MPFYSKDWRSPGEEWVKTEEGWEQKKILECGNSPTRSRMWTAGTDENKENTCNFVSRTSADDNNKENACINSRGPQKSCPRSIPGAVQRQMSEESDKSGGYSPPPHCQITVKSSREVGGYTGFSDVIKRLDFKGALHDTRRFNYVCKVLELLINESVMSLSGTAQRVVFSLLEELAFTVSEEKSNLRLLNKMLYNLKTMLVKYYTFGQQLGSSPLWEQHHAAISRIRSVAGQVQLGQAPFQLQQLPPECLREVVLRLSDHRDLQSSALAFSVLANITEETRIWRQLVQYHFSTQQLQGLLRPAAGTALTQAQLAALVTVSGADWQELFHRLRRYHGLREEYAEMVHLCRACRCLYWRCLGHPCALRADTLSEQERERLTIPIPPVTFLTFFSL